MARKRMIEVSIAYDKELNQLDDFEQLLFIKILPHTDDYGRFDGDAETIKARVEPLRNKKVETYETALRNICESGLMVCYETDRGKRVIQFKPETFERINAFLIKKRGNPEFPEYIDLYKVIYGDIRFISHRKYKDKVISIKKEEEERITTNEKVPTLEEVVYFFTESGYTKEDGENFWSYYQGQDWKTKSGVSIKKNWTAKVIGFMNNQKQYIINSSSSQSGSYLKLLPKERDSYWFGKFPKDTRIAVDNINRMICVKINGERYFVMPEDQVKHKLELWK